MKSNYLEITYTTHHPSYYQVIACAVLQIRQPAYFFCC